MRITSLVENTSNTSFPVEHGLSLFIEKNDRQKILFDMGQGLLFSENAERLGLDISGIDIAVVSHGHYDHGGGLKTFLSINCTAKVFVHNKAFLPHYSLRESGLHYIGLDPTLQNNEQIVLCEDKYTISKDMLLFGNVQGTFCTPHGNRLLFGPSKDINDSFDHEQNLIIFEDNRFFLFAGCAHQGIANIIKKAVELTGVVPAYVFGGMHLVKSGLVFDEEQQYIKQLACELKKYPSCKFYTMHCTGTEQYETLKTIMGSQIEYLSCGDSVIL